MSATAISWVSIDPGEVHCGTAWWIGAGPVHIEEMDPWSLEQKLWICTLPQIRALDLIVIEDFRLYPDKMAEQGYKQMITPKVIGAIEFIARHNGIHLELQGASIKKPTRAQLKARGIRQKAVEEGKGGHCADAELHGWYFLRAGGMDRWAQRGHQ